MQINNQQKAHKKTFINFITAFIILLFSFSALSSGDVNLSETQNISHLDGWQMTMGLAGGLALFLFGMDNMVNGLLIVTGDKMKTLLAKLTTNRVTAALTGAGVTAVIQSSSVTTVLTVGFVSAGLMSVTQAAGVVMGANLGTTVTAQIVAFKITNAALLMIAVGFLMQFAARLRRTKAIGQLILGLGLIFFGMNIMSEGMEPLRSYQPFLDLMLEMQNPLLAILVGAIFTALVQSSSATIGIVIVMASNGFLTLPAGIALAMGAHIGTTVTAMLASIGKSREALRTALIHFLFNFMAVVLWIAFIPELAQMAVYISAHDVLENSSMEIMAQNVPREIANANTLLTLIALLVFLPFTPLFVWAANKVVPRGEDEHATGALKAESLDVTFLKTPSVALDAVMVELKSYQKRQSLFYKRMVALIAEPDYDKLNREILNLEKFRSYEREILAYLGHIARGSLSDSQHKTYTELMTVLHSLESMNIAMRDSIFDVLMQMSEKGIRPSATMLNLVGKLTNEVGKAMEKSIYSVLDQDHQASLEVFSRKQTIAHLLEGALDHQMNHLEATEKRLAIFRYEMRIVEGFKQLYSMSKRIARMHLHDDQEV